MATFPQPHHVFDALRLQAPQRHGEVAEHIRGEEPIRGGSRLEERDELVGQVAARLVVRAHSAPTADMLAPSTAIVFCSSMDGLNSTTSVPAVTMGTCPGAA